MSAANGASQREQAQLAALLSQVQPKVEQQKQRAERQVNADDVARESSKEVLKKRQLEFKRKHGLLMGLFGLVMYGATPILIASLCGVHDG